MLRRAAIGFLAAGILALGYAAYLVIDAKAYQSSAQTRFEQARLAPRAAPVWVEGDAIGQLRIPRLGLAVMVVEGDSAVVLRRAVGHLAETAWPGGSSGNVVLAGHRDTFFRPLARVRIGDAIALNTREGDFAYRVESTDVVRPDDVEVLQPRGGRTLTLITCYPFSYLGPAPDRFIVYAREIKGAE